MADKDTPPDTKVARVETKDPREVWMAASRALQEEEKKLSKQRAKVAELRRALPAYPVTKEYIFEAAEDGAKVPLKDLFEDKEQLIVFHMMFDESWEKACSNCSFFVDGFSASYPHVAPRAAFVVITHATPAKVKAFKELKQWVIPCYSSHNSPFNYDFQVSFTPEQLEGGKGGDCKSNFYGGGHPKCCIAMCAALPHFALFRLSHPWQFPLLFGGTRQFRSEVAMGQARVWLVCVSENGRRHYSTHIQHIWSRLGRLSNDLQFA